MAGLRTFVGVRYETLPSSELDGDIDGDRQLHWIGKCRMVKERLSFWRAGSMLYADFL